MTRRPADDPDRPPDGDGVSGEAAGERDAPPSAEWRVRRIVVALDASPASAAAAHSAAELAARLRAELLGLFVEDAELLRLTDLPFAQQVGSFSAVSRRLAPGELARQLRGQAERARRQIAAGAARAAVSFHFDVVRGVVRREVAAAARAGELLSLGRVGSSRLRRLGSVAREAVVHGRGELLVLPEMGRLALPVVTAFGDSPGSRRALGAAAHLLAHLSAQGRAAGRFVVLLVAADDGQAERLADEVRRHLAAAGLPHAARFRRARPGDHRALTRAVAAERAGTLVLPAASPLVHADDLETVVAALDCAVLLVR